MPHITTSTKSKKDTRKCGTKRHAGTTKSMSYTEEDLRKAVDACKSTNPKRLTLVKAEEVFGVPKSTISDALKGKKSRTESHKSQRLLNNAEERALAVCCRNRGWRGDPITQDELRCLAGSICGTKPGEKWVHAFAQRNREISFKWARGGESKRASGLNKANVESFYRELEIASRDILPENIWNCDEKGLQENGGTIRRRVVVASEQKDPKVMGDESRKMITSLECINSVGGSIAPLIIHEGAEKDGEWIRCNPCGAHLAASPNGWTDSDVAFEWMRNVFEKETRPKTPGEKRLLILDGHVSHCSLNFILYAERHAIVVLLLPPHCTHRLQPLDVGVFGPLGKAWSKVVKDMHGRGYEVRKTNFLSAYAHAREEAMTAENIRSAFKKCGIHPYDPSVITEEDTAPAENTTSHSSQPIPASLPTWLEVIPEDESTPEQPLEIIQTSPNLEHMASSSHQTIKIPLRNQPLVEVSINVPRLRRTNLPERPSKYASHSEKDAKIEELFACLALDQDMLEEDYARMVLADKENGRMRQIAYGKSSRRGKTTPLRTGARILTATDQIATLCEADRKKAMGVVLKQMKPVLTSMAKALGQHERDIEAERERKERDAIRNAKIELDEAKKEVDKLEKSISYKENGLRKAEERLRKASTLLQWQKETSACQAWRDKLNPLTNRRGPILERFEKAQSEYGVLVSLRDARLVELKAIEDRYQEAIDNEEREQALEQERSNIERIRLSKLPLRPKDAVSLWTTRWQSLEIPNPVTKDDINDFRLPENAVRVSPGVYRDYSSLSEVTRGQSGAETIVPPVVTDDMIDPQLL